MKYLLYLGVLIYMYLSTPVAAQIGIKEVGTFSSAIIVFLFMIKLIEDINHKLFFRFKLEFYVILIAILLIIFKIVLGQLDQIKNIIFFFVVPMMLSIVLGTQNKSNKNTIRNIILFFFITECFLAMYERFSLTNVFPYVNEIEEVFVKDWGFRSSAFLGHPLANALIVSTIMGFILTTSMKLGYKLVFLLIGYVSLLCFNARAAILVWSFLTVIYILILVRDKNTKKGLSILLLLFLIVSAFSVYYLIADYGVGGRILQENINDGSAQTRLKVFDAFSYINNTDFLFGNATNYIPIMNKLGAGGVENSYIVLIINYGVLMFLVIFIVYFFLMKRFLKSYSSFNKFILVSSFLVVGSTNNGLAAALPWGVFILCFFSFQSLDKIQFKYRDRFITKSAFNKMERFQITEIPFRKTPHRINTKTSNAAH